MNGTNTNTTVQTQFTSAYTTNTRQRKKDVPKTWQLRDQIALFEQYAPNLTNSPAPNSNFAKPVNLFAASSRPNTSGENESPRKFPYLKSRAKTAIGGNRSGAPPVPKLNLLNTESQLIDQPTAMISPFRKELPTSRVLVHVPKLPIESITEQSAPQSQQTQHDEFPSNRRRYKSKETHRENEIEDTEKDEHVPDEDITWYANWVSGKVDIEGNPQAPDSIPVVENQEFEFVEEPPPYTTRKERQEKTFADVKRKRLASYYYHSELMEMDWRLQFSDEEKEAPTYNEHIYLMNLKIHELTLIFKEKLKKQYELMQRELEMEEIKFKTELVAVKKQFDAKMNNLLRHYQAYRIDKLDLQKNRHDNAVMKKRFTDMTSQIKELEQRDQQQRDRLQALQKNARLTTFRSIVRTMTKGSSDEFTDRDRSHIENEPFTIRSNDLEKILLDGDGNIDQEALLNILAVNHELTDQLQRTRATTQHLHERVLVLQDSLKNAQIKQDDEGSFDDDLSDEGEQIQTTDDQSPALFDQLEENDNSNPDSLGDDIAVVDSPRQQTSQPMQNTTRISPRKQVQEPHDETSPERRQEQQLTLATRENKKRTVPGLPIIESTTMQQLHQSFDDSSEHSPRRGNTQNPMQQALLAQRQRMQNAVIATSPSTPSRKRRKGRRSSVSQTISAPSVFVRDESVDKNVIAISVRNAKLEKHAVVLGTNILESNGPLRELTDLLAHINKSISCGFCRMLLTDSHILVPCGHNYCKRCIKQLRDDVGELRCIKCKKGGQGIMENKLLVSIIHLLKQVSHQMISISELFKRMIVEVRDAGFVSDIDKTPWTEVEEVKEEGDTPATVTT